MCRTCKPDWCASLLTRQSRCSDKLAGMLGCVYAEGQTTVRGHRGTVLAISTAEFDDGFRDYVQEEHGHLLDNLDQWHKLHAQASQQLSAGEWSALVESATRMIELHPAYVDSDSPYLMLAKAHDELGSRDLAIDAMKTFVDRGGYDPASLKQGSDWLISKRAAKAEAISRP